MFPASQTFIDIVDVVDIVNIVVRSGSGSEYLCCGIAILTQKSYSVCVTNQGQVDTWLWTNGEPVSPDVKLISSTTSRSSANKTRLTVFMGVCILIICTLSP